MTIKELLDICRQYGDFEIQFSFTDSCARFPNVRTFSNLELDDIGYSDKVICLTGSEVN
ncbi:MAG: hypothetical protein HFH68_01470 [Lachnospiraceae bacterium]|nr:hypothetical protein [Lachnospiraceae bacterium]